MKRDLLLSGRKVEENKFHVGNAIDGKHYWLTPPDVMEALNKEFKFNFDPAPYPVPKGFDGLTCDWGKSNYVNPPFGSIIHEGKKKGITAWVRKAIEENKKGKKIVLVYPMNKWVFMLLKQGAEIRNLGDVRWHSIEENKAGKGTGRHIACFILNTPQNKVKSKGCGKEFDNEEKKTFMRCSENDLCPKCLVLAINDPEK